MGRIWLFKEKSLLFLVVFFGFGSLSGKSFYSFMHPFRICIQVKKKEAIRRRIFILNFIYYINTEMKKKKYFR